MQKGTKCNQPARETINRPDWFDVESALRACQDVFGGTAKLDLLVRGAGPGQTALIIKAAWYPSWDRDCESPEVTVEWPYDASRDGKLDQRCLAHVARLYDLLDGRVAAAHTPPAPGAENRPARGA